jgi:hypothetical protein
MRSKSEFRLSTRLVELGVASPEEMSALREIAIVELLQPRALEIDHGGTLLALEERTARGRSGDSPLGSASSDCTTQWDG